MLLISHQYPGTLWLCPSPYLQLTLRHHGCLSKETRSGRVNIPDQLSARNKWELEGKTVNFLPYRVGQL